MSYISQIHAKYDTISLYELFITQWFLLIHLKSPRSSVPFWWGRRSCLGLRTGVSPHFSINSMREILTIHDCYERGSVPLPSSISVCLVHLQSSAMVLCYYHSGECNYNSLCICPATPNCLVFDPFLRSAAENIPQNGCFNIN